jgi:hypothetical protein
MSTIIENVEAHYETLEVPFGRIYHWHQAHVTLQCDCGEILTFSGTSATDTCRCGAPYGTLVHGIHYREEHLRDEDIHPWHYDVQSQADQHLRDETACTEDSSWRYNDVTSGKVGDDKEERWKKARA